MKRYILALVLMLIQWLPVIGESLTDKLGVGMNVGGAKIFGDHLHTGFGPALETYLKYQLNQRYFLIGSLGYAELSDGTFHADKYTFRNNTFNLDIKGAINLMPQKVTQPYVYLGLGAINFHSRWISYSPIGYFDATFIFGGGLEYQINPKIGLNAFTDYRFTTSDHLDDINYGKNDGYLNIRGGVTYYLSPQTQAAPPKVLAEKLPLNEVDEFSAAEDDAELNALVEGIKQFEETSSADFAMDKYIELKSRVDQLNDAIRQKLLQIDELKSQLQIRKEKAVNVAQQMPGKKSLVAASTTTSMSSSPSAMTSSNINADDYSASYEQALEYFYAREYDTAIQIFSNLLGSNPNHPLASNSQYWIGECYFGKRDYQAAVESFNSVIDIGNSAKKDDALLMLGRSYSKLGNGQMAKTMYERLMSEFPDSEYFSTAEKYANELEMM